MTTENPKTVDPAAVAAMVTLLEEQTAKTTRAFERACKSMGVTIDKLGELLATVAPGGPDTLRDDLGGDLKNRVGRTILSTMIAVDALPQVVDEQREHFAAESAQRHALAPDLGGPAE